MSEAAVRMLSSSSSWVLAPSCSPEIVRVATRITSTPSSEDRKSTRLNSSHLVISYAVFCLKKKNYAPRLVLTELGPPWGSYTAATQQLAAKLGINCPIDTLGPVRNTHDEAVLAIRLARYV